MPTPATPRPRKCPICGKPAAEVTRPFCSEQCRQVDLNRWLSGSYVILASGDDDDEDGRSSGG